MVFVETPAFTKRIGNYLNDDEYGQLQAFLGNHPEVGKLIPHSQTPLGSEKPEQARRLANPLFLVARGGPYIDAHDLRKK